MSDQEVAKALRSDAGLVVVQAPAGCGKTFQGADYAVDICQHLAPGRVLVLTHTHAARETFAARAVSCGTKIEVRTIDSLVMQVATAYHATLGLPLDVAAWVRSSVGSHDAVAERVSTFLSAAEPLRRALANRYPFVILDEHQDASAAQHSIAMAVRNGGALLRIFGDPMQQIYARSHEEFDAAYARWDALWNEADSAVELDTPHRWASGSRELGVWVLAARDRLRRGGFIDLTGQLPPTVHVVRADNMNDGYLYRPPPTVVAAMHRARRAGGTCLVLTPSNKTVATLHGGIGGAIPIWEGHVRQQLDRLAVAVSRHEGNPDKLCAAAVNFVHQVATGFTKSAFSNRLLSEIASRCAIPARGKPAKLQELAECIIRDPTHRGLAAMLTELDRLVASEPAFQSIRFHHRREMRDAMCLGDHDSVDAALAALAQRRLHHRSGMPNCAISTIHKSKGLEADRVVVVPLDTAHFPDDQHHRCLLYVALSRARSALTLVVPTNGISRLIRAA